MPLKISPDLDDPTTGKEEEGKEELPSRPDVFGSSPEVPPPKKPKLHGKAFVTEGLEDGPPDGGAPQVTEQIQPQPQTTIINIPPIADDIITLGEQETVDVGGVAVPGRSDQHDREALSCCQGDSESLSLLQSETFQTPSTALQHQPSRWDTPGSGQNSDSQTVLRNSTAAREHQDSDMEVVKVLPSSFDPLPQRGQIRKETQWKSRLPRTDSTTRQTELSDCGKVLPSSKDSCVNEQITSPPLSYSKILKGEVSMQKAVENRERVYGGIGTRKDAQGQGTRGSFAELPQRTLNYDREDDDLFLEEFFSDLEEEEEHDPRKQYVIRFRYKGLDATKLTKLSNI
ncbi:UNVERIFIED_CONTAM: hypothetical protein K2H54_062999 [Gekko kuhli]